MEQFIEQSNALLAARPATTRVTTKYAHKKVIDSGERVSKTAKPAKIVVKTYDPVSGLVYKHKLKKMNELSRVLASLGPHSFEFENARKRGIASIMADKEFLEEAHTETAVEAPDAEQETAPTQKAKKKKSKKH